MKPKSAGPPAGRPAHCAPCEPDEEALVAVVLHTALGNVELVLDARRAPLSVRAFLDHVDDGSFARSGAFYRAVRGRENDRGHQPIDILQAGLPHMPRTRSAVLHESTAHTGLLHLDGTLSLARDAPGTATGADFFICIGDQPALDAGGARHADGAGFAAIGRVTVGMSVVRAIHELPTRGATADPYRQGQILTFPVCILQATRAAVALRALS
jgi:peptidyl-prolyl cis-trans isomerase A (cyclophilin A)